ncbi:PQQ-dependent sugar dehydrogenase [Burkholderia plantarii]|uniref:PQQ-dependent sugar dehydrogenase n=1 Tax=Burkholderia plantarii TaxID=41899 RepID=UPI0018DE2821|nr:sorbosone dehydrogenase family protein [Burkholderia plantarii]MBI0325963.1 sorbosone dehydrogenase family protein [Burkholderia plantarii]
MRPTRSASRRSLTAVRRCLRAAGAICVVLATAIADSQAAPPVERLSVPPGFHVELFAADVPTAREMAWSPRGILYVGSTDGVVHALTVERGRVTGRHVVASGLEMPVGVAYRDGALYISAISRILRLDGIDAKLAAPPKPVVVSDALPSDRQHGWKFIAFGPDGKLYVPTGAPCNVCEPDRDRYAMLGRMNPDGSDYQVFARGIRNTVGFDWHPATHALWFTDNGRDMLGDDVPDDELNQAPRAGLDFGYPYCHAGDVPDPQYGKGHPCSGFTPPVLKLGAHVAALGMRFYTGTMFPAGYRDAIFIAEHGSWNRSSKVGYRVVSVTSGSDGRGARMQVFAQGWLQPDGSVWGRPADVLSLPDGSLLVSDDYAGAIYRITYTGH